jgi:hypothetical protein
MAALNWKWSIPTPFTIGQTTFANDYIAAINSMVTANSGASDAVWEVATYSSTSPRYVLLKRKDGSAGRISFFGQNGSTPNAAAIVSGVGASRVAVAYSATSASNSHDASYLSAAPLSAADYMPGIAFGVNFGVTDSIRMYYGEHSGGVVVCGIRRTQAISPTVACFYGGAGEHFVDPSGSFLPTLLSAGDSSPNSWIAASSLAYVNATVSLSYSATQSTVFVRKNGVNLVAFRKDLATLALNENLHLEDAESTMYFTPITCVFDPNYGRRAFAGKLRQIAFGPQAVSETFLHDAATDNVVAHALAPHIAAIGDAMWFVNVEV